MQEDTAAPQINISKIVVGGGIAGAFFALASMTIFLIGIPLIRYTFPVALVVGGVVAVMLHFRRHEMASTGRFLLPRS